MFLPPLPKIPEDGFWHPGLKWILNQTKFLFSTNYKLYSPMNPLYFLL
ncbi:hypothetical protein GCWU000341_00078 [Oribacterium sp. oral taxon 078 str. F0262]|nr:hypothetical protein GCWU000341_00078 [Oribacterium sp. oral taxon 078 str. F0262]